MILIILSLLIVNITKAIDHNEDAICSVCYSQPCDPLNTTVNLLLFCSIFNSTQCGPCNSTCDQCSLISNSSFICQCPNITNTTAPTVIPTSEPTSLSPTTINTTISPTPPTVSPTSAPTVFFECTFCNNTSPLPPSIPCNGSSKLLMLCNTPVNGTCIVCPLFCSFCFPLLLPTPSYTCECPPTEAPTEVPTSKSPTKSPTISPTTLSPTRRPNHNTINITIYIILIAFAVILCIFFTLCCITVLPDGLRGRIKNRETRFYATNDNNNNKQLHSL